MKRALSLIVKIGLGIVLFVVLVLATALLLSQTPWGKQKIKTFALNRLDRMLAGEVAIDRLDGNLFGTLILDGVRVRDDQGALFVSIKRVALNYDLFDLFDNAVSLDKLELIEPDVTLIQYPDSSWSYEHLLEPNEEADTTNTGQFNWRVLIDEARIRDGRLTWRILLPDTPEPVRRFTDLDLGGDFTYSKEGMQLGLDSLNTTVGWHNLGRVHLATGLQLDPDGMMRFNGTRIRTPRSSVDLNLVLTGIGAGGKGQPIRFQTDVRADSLTLAEIEPFLPDTLAVQGNPRFTLRASGSLNDIAYELHAHIPRGGRADLTGTLGLPVAAAEARSSRDTTLRYAAKGRVQNLNIGYLTRKPDLPTDLSGRIDLAGVGTDPNRLELRLDADLTPSRVVQFQLGATTLHGELSRGVLDFDTDAGVPGGRVRANGWLTPFAERIAYAVDGSTRGFNLAPLSGNPKLASRLNLRFSAEGAGTELTTLTSRIKLRGFDSRIQGNDIDSVVADLALDHGLVDINRLRIVTAAANLVASGRTTVEPTNSGSLIDYTMTLKDLRLLRAMTPLDTLAGTGQIKGSLAGSLADLTATAAVTLDSLQVNGITTPRANGTLVADNFRYDDPNLLESLHLAADLQAQFIRTGPNATLRRLTVQVAKNDPEQYAVRATVRQDSSRDVRLVGLVTINDDERRVDLDSLVWRIGAYTFLTEGASQFTLRGSAIQIRDFRLRGENSRIRIDGTLDTLRTQDLTVEASNLKIERISAFLGRSDDIRGTLDLAGHLTGSFDDPTLSLTSKLVGAAYGTYTFDSLGVQATYQNLKTELEARLRQSPGNELLASGTVPADLRLSGAGERLPTDRPIALKLTTEGIGLKLLEGLFPGSLSETSGTMTLGVTVGGTIRQPTVDGRFAMTDGRYTLRPLGVKHQTTLAIRFQTDKVQLETARIHSGDGDLTAGGQVNLGENFTLNDFALTLDAKRFLLIDTPEYHAVVTSTLRPGGTLNRPTLNGNVTVDEADILLPETNADARGQVRIFGTVDPTLFAVKIDSTLSTTDPVSPLWKALALDVSLSIPRNTWLRGLPSGSDGRNSLNAEIGNGKLRAQKDAGERDARLYGSVATLRGSYNAYGRQFRIQRGIVAFDGQPNRDPVIDATAQYDLNTRINGGDNNGSSASPQNVRIFVDVTGPLRELSVKLRSSQESLSQEDIVSILLFGKPQAFTSTEERGAQRSLLNRAQQQGLGVASSSFTAELERTLGNNLHLDVVEIVSGGAGGSRVRVGKYLSSDLFLTFTQQLNGGQQTSVEYTLNRYLIFRGTLGSGSQNTANPSGGDLIGQYEY